DPDDAAFILPANMPAALTEFCKKTGQPTPAEPGAVIRCALESLALRYRWVLERLEELVGRRLETIHLVGGGSQNTLLCPPAAGGRLRPRRRRRAHRSDGDRQRAGAGARARADRLAGGRSQHRSRVVRGADVYAAQSASVAGAVSAVPKAASQLTSRRAKSAK